MNSVASKLTELENVKIFNHIQNYFNELSRKNRDFAEKTKNATQIAYETDIRLFFHLIRSKSKGAELEYLSLDDINITQDDFEEYIDALYNLKDVKGENKYVIKTINKKIVALKSFLRYMKKKKVIDTDISYLELIKGEKERKVHYGVLEPEEVLTMANLCLEERDKGNIKRLLILTAFKTGLRISEVLDLKWKESFLIKSNQVFIIGVGKGNKEFEIRIPIEFYNELQQLDTKKSNKVFEISSRRVCDLMARLRTKMNIQDSRNICFHSIRKSFGTIIYRTTGDIFQAMIALRHSNVTTTQIYLGVDNIEINETIFSLDKIKNDLYKQVELKDLVDAIDELPKSAQLIINMKLQEILNKNK
jgi:integrase